MVTVPALLSAFQIPDGSSPRPPVATPPPPPPPPTHHLEVTMLGVLGVTRVLVVECRLHVTVHDNR